MGSGIVLDRGMELGQAAVLVFESVEDDSGCFKFLVPLLGPIDPTFTYNFVSFLSLVQYSFRYAIDTVSKFSL